MLGTLKSLYHFNLYLPGLEIMHFGIMITPPHTPNGGCNLVFTQVKPIIIVTDSNKKHRLPVQTQIYIYNYLVAKRSTW